MTTKYGLYYSILKNVLSIVSEIQGIHTGIAVIKINRTFPW